MKAALLIVALTAAAEARAQGAVFPTIYAEDLLIATIPFEPMFFSLAVMTGGVATHHAIAGQRDPWLKAGLWLGGGHILAGLTTLAISAVAHDRTAPHLLTAAHLAVGAWNLVSCAVALARSAPAGPELTPPPLVPVVLTGKTVVGGKRWAGLGVEVSL